jgi:hypothetical protein
MPLFGPESSRPHARPFARLLPVLIAALTLALVAATAPRASAQEVPGTVAADAIPAPPDTAGDSAPPIDPPPPAGDPAPPPEPVLQPPDPVTPPPEAQPPADTPVVPSADDHRQTVPSDGSDRTAPSHDAGASTEQATTSWSPAAQAPSTADDLVQITPATTAPLGWDVYDDALVADLHQDGGAAVGMIGGGDPPSFGGFRALGGIGPAAAQDRRRDTEPPSRAIAAPAGSMPGGPGPSQGPSMGLFGAAGGASAGVALLTLLGMACGWLVLAPDRQRAFLTSTATWRPSAYVPPIEHPG